MNKQYIAHVKQENGQWIIHPLEEHLRKVARRTSDSAGIFNEKSQAWAYLTGLLHDLGKYSIDFQNMIASKSGYDVEAHLEGATGKVNHSSAGALHACRLKPLQGIAGKMLSYLIAGHHAGLSDWYGKLNERLENTPENEALYQAALAGNIPDDILNPMTQMNALALPDFLNPKQSGYQSISVSFWLRMLFSCLVDADFLDTEAFMDDGKANVRGMFPELFQLKQRFEHYMDKFKNCTPTPVNQLRREVLEAVVSKADQPTGIYTLTVPTGGGKTLTGLAYALQHALHHGKDRIVYVLPFTSILEQTAAVFRDALNEAGVDCVIEHHSAMDSNRETQKSRLATENWDAPIILTTNVQFFESLFANRTSRCRKLHNIANSVVILDEAQQIPPEFKQPIEAALQLLAKDYNTTIVLSTATQPALELGETTELAPNPERLFNVLKRVDIQIPESLTEAVEWESLAGELAVLSKVLCIVGRRDDAKTLYQLMPKGTYHLSALMCPTHRSRVIAEIKQKLQEPDAEVRVISTQLVEAGVDMDFPVVYRALAGLDSIAQAAGRCNREGKLSELGQVKVFVAPSQVPAGILRKAVQTSRGMLEGKTCLEQSPALFQQYFEMLYGAVNSQDKEGILELLSMKSGQPHFQFKEAAQKFQLIDDSQSSTVLIPYDDQAMGYLAALKRDEVSRGILRKLQRYTVSIPERIAERMFKQGDLLEVLPDLYQLKSMAIYREDLGLDISQDVLLETSTCIF